MAQTESAQVLEAYREVIAASAKGQQDFLAPDQGSLYRDVMQESYKTILSMAPPLQLQAGFPIQKSELLARLEQGQQDWAPELQSSSEDTEEEPVKEQLSTWSGPGTWWNSYRSPVNVPSSDSSASDNESSSEKEEERNVKPEWVRITKPRAPLLGKCEVKQEGCEQLGHPRDSMKMPFCWTNEKDRGLVKSRKRKLRTDPGKNHYVCPQCGNSFNRKSSLKRHITTIHDGAKPYEWPPRRKSSLEKSKRRTRARSSHSGREPYECPECGESFMTNASFTKHRRTHTNETANECPECGKSYMEERTLIKHLMTAHSGTHLSKCLDCGKGFLREGDLSRHQTMIHGVESSHQSLDREKCYQKKFSHIKQSPSHTTQEGSDIGEYVFECPDCGMCFKAERCFLNHQRMHMEQKCQQPDKKSISKGGVPFARNQETHVEIKCNAEFIKMEETLRTCPDCGKIFRDSRCFANHLSMHIKEPSANADGQEAVEESATDQQEDHLKEKPYKCCRCGKTYATQYNLNRHQHIHADNKPYKCTVCGKTFAYRYSLAHHEATHPEGKVCQHKCSYCGKGFTTKTSLSRHLQLHEMGRPYQCDICGKAFAYRYSLTHHQEIHVQGQAQKCLFCWKVFRTSHSLSRHKRIHMETRSYQCSVCGKAFGTKYSFCRHQDMHLNRSLSHSSSSGKGLTDGSALAKEQASDTDENSNNWSGNSTFSEHSVKETAAECSESVGGTPLGKCQNAHLEENSAKRLDSEGTSRDNPVPLQDQATHAHKSVGSWSDNLISSGHQGIHMKEPPADFSEMVDSDILTKPQSTPLKENPMKGLDGGETLWDHSVDTKDQDSYGEEDASEGTYDLVYPKQQGACMEGSLPESEMQGGVTASLNHTKHQSVHKGVNSIPRLDNEEPRKGSLTHPHLRGVQKGSSQYTCSNCGKPCRDKYSLTRHERTHTSERPYQCQKCGKRFREIKNLTRHQITHTDLRPFSCSKCGKRFRETKNLIKHQITHTDLRPFPCNKCGKHFKTKSTLDKHQKVHDKPFCCSHCGKRVTTNSILKNHLRTHTEEKPFKCAECGKDYRTKASFNKHREGHLKKNSSEVPKEDQPNQIF